MTTHKTGLHWHIGDHTATTLISDTPVLSRGTTVSLRFLFEGGTLHDDGTLHADSVYHGDLRSHYQALLERLEFADKVVKRGVAHNGVPWIRERIPKRASFDTQVVLIEPESEVIDVEPFWAAIVGGSTDHRPTREEDSRWMTLELFVLAAGKQYLGTYGEIYGTTYDTDRHAAREALLDDLGGEVV